MKTRLLALEALANEESLERSPRDAASQKAA